MISLPNAVIYEVAMVIHSFNTAIANRAMMRRVTIVLKSNRTAFFAYIYLSIIDFFNFFIILQIFFFNITSDFLI